MNKLSQDYYLRKCYLETNQVPTQSVIMNAMSPALAKVYFKFMAPKVKLLAGLEPPLKGGGNNWCVPPEDLLKGNYVLKPLKKELLSKLGCNGLAHYGEAIRGHHLKNQEEQIRKAVHENDAYWKLRIKEFCKIHYYALTKKEASKNSDKIKNAFFEFTMLYASSMNNIERLLLDSAIGEITRVKENVYSEMSCKYRDLLKKQATMLYDRYTDKLETKKQALKEQFIQNLELLRTNLSNSLHDINLEKHIAIEKLRKLLECQNLACQIYIAIKERTECEKTLKETEDEHKRIVILLNEEIDRIGLEIEVAKENERRRENYKTVWQKKVCEVIKKFQEFIAYSLKTVPEQAEFFINVEKLLLLQFSAAIEKPSTESLFQPEDEEFQTPKQALRPFYIFCDDESKPQIDTELCTKPYSVSSSHLPVIVVNKRCIYANCDNLEEFADEVKQFLSEERNKDSDLLDSHDYSFAISVKYTESQQLLDLKKKSSLMQILQNDIPNARQVPTECTCQCEIPHCFGEHREENTQILFEINTENRHPPKVLSAASMELSQSDELAHAREPKWESFFNFIKPKCRTCPKFEKKSLKEHLPPYMKKMSAFDYPDLPNYEKCSLTTLKRLVKNTRQWNLPAVQTKVEEPKTKDSSTQYSDQEFEQLCTCVDENQAINILNEISKDVDVETLSKTNKEVYVQRSPSTCYLNQRVESFVNDRKKSLKNLLENSPELLELFIKQSC